MARLLLSLLALSLQTAPAVASSWSLHTAPAWTQCGDDAECDAASEDDGELCTPGTDCAEDD